jgi:predicted glycosyltransferase
MGGYNTFCEILSFDKPALLVPRSRPRQEQTIRARRAAEHGHVSVLEDPKESDAASRDPLAMAAALRRLADQPSPSSAALPGMLHGLTGVCAHIDPLLAGRASPEPLRAGL